MRPKNNIWLVGENQLWLIQGEQREYYWNMGIKEINLTEKTVTLSGIMPDGIKLNSFPANSTLEIKRQRAGCRDDYKATDYTRIALFNCSLLNCRIIDPVKVFGVFSEDTIEVLATIKYESMELADEDNQN